jgi:hypothetical protein
VLGSSAVEKIGLDLLREACAKVPLRRDVLW